MGSGQTHCTPPLPSSPAPSRPHAPISRRAAHTHRGVMYCWDNGTSCSGTEGSRSAREAAATARTTRLGYWLAKPLQHPRTPLASGGLGLGDDGDTPCRPPGRLRASDCLLSVGSKLLSLVTKASYATETPPSISPVLQNETEIIFPLSQPSATTTETHGQNKQKQQPPLPAWFKV